MGQEEKSPGECDGCGGAYSECATRLFQHSGERLSNEHEPRTDRLPTGRIIFMVDPTEPLTDTPQHPLNVSAAKRQCLWLDRLHAGPQVSLINAERTLASRPASSPAIFWLSRRGRRTSKSE